MGLELNVLDMPTTSGQPSSLIYCVSKVAAMLHSRLSEFIYTKAAGRAWCAHPSYMESLTVEPALTPPIRSAPLNDLDREHDLPFSLTVDYVACPKVYCKYHEFDCTWSRQGWAPLLHQTPLNRPFKRNLALRRPQLQGIVSFFIPTTQ